jgi:guanine nucleotide-binding protein alpha-1 subunit
MPTDRLEVDPLSFALRPPSNETLEARQVRLQREAEAKARSNAIDELLRLEREALKRKRGTHADVKLLLLGKDSTRSAWNGAEYPLQDKPRVVKALYRSSSSYCMPQRH